MRLGSLSQGPAGPAELALVLVTVATGPYASEGSGCPAPDTLLLAAPGASKGSLTQYAGRILRVQDLTFITER